MDNWRIEHKCSPLYSGITLSSLVANIFNTWRIQAETARLHHRPFLIIYILCSFIVTMPLMYLEVLCGQFCGGSGLDVGLLFGNYRYAMTGISLIGVLGLIIYNTALLNWSMWFLSHSTGQLYADKEMVTNCDEITEMESCATNICIWDNQSNTCVDNLLRVSMSIFSRLSCIAYGDDAVLEFDCREVRFSNIMLSVAFIVTVAVISMYIRFGGPSYQIVCNATNLCGLAVVLAVYIYTFTIPGAIDNISFNLNFSFKDMFDLDIWSSAVVQTINTATIGYGVIVAYAGQNVQEQRIGARYGVLVLAQTVLGIVAALSYVSLFNISMNDEYKLLVEDHSLMSTMMIYYQQLLLLGNEQVAKVMSVMYWVGMVIVLSSNILCYIIVFKTFIVRSSVFKHTRIAAYYHMGVAVFLFTFASLHVTKYSYFELRLIDLYLVVNLTPISAFILFYIAYWVVDRHWYVDKFGSSVYIIKHICLFVVSLVPTLTSVIDMNAMAHASVFIFSEFIIIPLSLCTLGLFHRKSHIKNAKQYIKLMLLGHQGQVLKHKTELTCNLSDTLDRCTCEKLQTLIARSIATPLILTTIFYNLASSTKHQFCAFEERIIAIIGIFYLLVYVGFVLCVVVDPSYIYPLYSANIKGVYNLFCVNLFAFGIKDLSDIVSDSKASVKLEGDESFIVE